MERMVSGWFRRAWTRHQAVATGALIVLCLALYGPPALRTPFFTKGEPREALVVRQMAEHGGWVLPRRPAADGWTIASKPPFFHWLGALASRAAGGTTELTVRLPSLALAGTAVVLVWLVGGPILGARASFMGAVVLATTFEWVNAAQSARVDATLAALMTVGLLIFYRGFVGEGLSRGAALLAYGSLAAAALTKGPVGFALPGLVLGVALLAAGRWRLVPRFHPLLGAAVIVGLVGGWYLAAWSVGGNAFYEKQVLKENVFRFLGASRLASGHAHPFHYYLYTFPAGFLPWTPVLALAFVAALRAPAARRDPRLLFPLVWVGVVFAFYSAAAAKRAVYLIALYPAAALLCGWWLDGLVLRGQEPRWLGSRPARTVAVVLGIVVALPLVVALAEGFGFPLLDLIGPLLHARDRQNLPLVRSVIVSDTALVAGSLAIVLAAFAIGCRTLARGRWSAAFAAAAALASALWVLVFGVFRPEIAARRSLASFMAETAARTAGAALYFHPPTFDFSAAFYAPGGVGYLTADETRRRGGPRWVLLWDVDLARLDPQARAALEILSTSAGTDPKGRRHMHLARLDRAAAPDPGA